MQRKDIQVGVEYAYTGRGRSPQRKEGVKVRFLDDHPGRYYGVKSEPVVFENGHWRSADMRRFSLTVFDRLVTFGQVQKEGLGTRKAAVDSLPQDGSLTEATIVYAIAPDSKSLPAQRVEDGKFRFLEPAEIWGTWVAFQAEHDAREKAADERARESAPRSITLSLARAAESAMFLANDDEEQAKVILRDLLPLGYADLLKGL